MKKILTMGLVLFALMAVSTTHAGIINGDFETGDLTGWSGNATIVDGIAHVDSISQTFDVSAGDVLLFEYLWGEGWIDNYKGENYDIVADITINDYSIFYKSERLSGFGSYSWPSSGWQLFNFEFGNDENVQLEISFRASGDGVGEGYFWVDNFCLIKPSTPNFTISGYILEPDGSPIVGVLVTPSTLRVDPSTTDTDGYYKLAVEQHWSGSVTPTMPTGTFNPSTLTYADVTSNLPDQNFTIKVFPHTPVPSAPSIDAIVSTLTPSFEWSEFQDGGDGKTQTGYQLRVICDDEPDRTVYDTGLIPDTSGHSHTYQPPGTYSGFDSAADTFRISEPLEYEKRYYWQVRYLDRDGDWSFWSGADPLQDFYTRLQTHIITRLTDNEYDDEPPQINASGHIAWVGFDGHDKEIFFYNGTGITQITDNEYDDWGPRINASGYVVWIGSDGHDDEIFYYKGTGIIQITDNEYDDWGPRINASGYVVWIGSDGHDDEIFYYNSTGINQLTDNGYQDKCPAINSSGYVVWNGYEEYFLYNGVNITQLSNDVYFGDWGCPQINSSGHVLWSGHEGWSSELFLFDGANRIRLTNNDHEDHCGDINPNGYVVWAPEILWLLDGGEYGIREIRLYDGTETRTIFQIEYNTLRNEQPVSVGCPQINPSSHVVWAGGPWGNMEIFFYDGLKTIHLTNNDYNDWGPQINSSGHVIWKGYVGNQDSELFLYDGTRITRITDNDYDENVYGINAKGYVVWQEWDGHDYEIFLLKPIKTIIRGDFNGDGAVTYEDFYNVFQPAYGTKLNDQGFVPECDMNQDGIIDMLDYTEWYSCYMDANPQ
jgi:hypothetical protein